MIEFVCKLDPSVQASLGRQQRKKIKWLIIVIEAFFAVLGVLSLALSIGEEIDVAGIAAGVVLIIIAVLYYPFLIWINKRGQKRISNSMSLMSSDTVVTYRFYEEGMTVTTASGEDYEGYVKARYNYLYKVEETNSQYFLWISKVQSYVVDKGSITEGTIEQLNVLFGRVLGQKYKPFTGKR